MAIPNWLCRFHAFRLLYAIVLSPSPRYLGIGVFITSCQAFPIFRRSMDSIFWRTRSRNLFMTRFCHE